MTDFLISARGSGKTTALIKWALENPKSIIITHSAAAAVVIVKTEPRLKGRVWSITSHPKLTDKCVAIDEVDLVLQSLLENCTVKIATATRQES